MNNIKLLLLRLVSVLLIINMYATDGTLDTSFNGVGFVTVGSSATGNAVAVQTNGSIVVGINIVTGPSSRSAELIRLNASGVQDMSFGGTGIVSSVIPSVNDVIIQPDGKILICGKDPVSGNGMVARYNSDGSLDATFAIASIANAQFNALMLQTDGKIIAAGESVTNQAPIVASPLVIRFNTNGQMDVTFATTGLTSAFANDIAIQADGRAVVVIDGNSVGFDIVRYNTDGSLDTSFDQGTKPTGVAMSIVIQQDGKCVVGGILPSGLSNGFFQVARYDTQGNLDTSYNSAGTTPGINNSVPSTGLSNADTVLQADGKVVCVGFDPSDSFVQLARYNTNGTVDDSFGTSGTGIVTIPVGFANAAALQSNGYILIAGGNNSSSALIARYVSSPALAVTQIKSPFPNIPQSTHTPITFAGQAQDPSLVYLLLNGVTQAGTHTDPNNWTITTTISTPGVYTVQAVSAYQNGDLDIASDPITLTVGPTAPSSFTGTITKNVFLNKTECVLQATFTPSIDPTTTQYIIAQNGIVLAVIPATAPLQFVFCASCKGNAFNGITVSAATASGIAGAPQPLVIV